jgi:O-antigen/teichoic acid export membrane protein
MKPQATRIRRNSVFAFLSQAIRIVTNFLMFVGIARFYGAQAFGQFTTAHAFSMFFILFADFGFDALLTTEIARHRDRAPEIARRYWGIKMGFASTASLVMAALPWVHPFSPETSMLIRMFSLYVLFSSLTNYIFALFKGFEELHREALISLFMNGALLVFLLLLGSVGAPLVWVAAAFIGSRVVGLAIALWTARPHFGTVRIIPEFSGIRELWPKVRVFGLHFVFGNLFFQIDTILLAFWKGDADVGIYQSAWKIVALALIIPDVLINPLLPVLTRLHHTDEPGWRNLGRLLNKTLLFVGVPILCVFSIYADQIIHIVYGANVFADAVTVLRIFSAIILVRFSVETFALLLTTSGRQETRMWIVIGGTAFNIAVNMYAIPRYGAIGAAVVSLVTNVGVGAAYVWCARWENASRMFDRRTVVPCLLAAALSAAAWELSSVPLWVGAPLLLAAYGGAVVLAGYGRNELHVMFVRS